MQGALPSSRAGSMRRSSTKSSGTRASQSQSQPVLCERSVAPGGDLIRRNVESSCATTVTRARFPGRGAGAAGAGFAAAARAEAKSPEPNLERQRGYDPQAGCRRRCLAELSDTATSSPPHRQTSAPQRPIVGGVRRDRESPGGRTGIHITVPDRGCGAPSARPSRQ